jgi:large subunit ribosomal protein L3
MIGIIGKKIGMTQIFNEDGDIVPVTVLQAGPCRVVQKKLKERDGYNAVQLGFENVNEEKAKKPLAGHFKKAGVEPQKILKEIKVDEIDKFRENDEIKVDIFSDSKYVNIQALSKGKGFTGVMKRWGFSGMPASHGTHRKHRHPGSIGQSAYPGRVFKGKKMAGRVGNDQVTVRNLSVVGIEPDKNILLVKGSIPGARGSTLLIYSDMPLPEKKTEPKQKEVEKPKVEKQAAEAQVDKEQVKEKEQEEQHGQEQQEHEQQIEEKQGKQAAEEQEDKKETEEGKQEEEKQSEQQQEEKKEEKQPEEQKQEKQQPQEQETEKEQTEEKPTSAEIDEQSREGK